MASATSAAAATTLPKPSRSSASQSTIFPGVARGERPGLQDVATLIKEGKVSNIIIMAGAGISTSAGIPDFRSPETGLYANLEKYNLPYPEAIFDIDFFREQPQAFYTLAKELYPGNFKPTRTHYFFRMLQDKGILKSVFTQNIDTLERVAGLKDDLVIEAHGSFAEAACLECKRIYTKESIKPEIQRGEVVYCKEEACKGNDQALVKPKIVFFGEGLPEQFFSRLRDFAEADLLIVLGTSLTVQPFASLIHRVPVSCPRLLLNLESVGEIEPPEPWLPSALRSQHAARLRNGGFDFEGYGAEYRQDESGGGSGIRDVRWLGPSDEGVDRLADELGWRAELDALVEREWARLDREKRDEAAESEVDQESGETRPAVKETASVPGEPRAGAESDVNAGLKPDVDAGRDQGASAPNAATPEERQKEIIEAVGAAVNEDKDADQLARDMNQVKLDGDKDEDKGKAT